MHRMCQVIHTDFKPENVVISLKDSEVQEIARTGQLTTSKMFDKAEIVKKLNMKIAGTLQNERKQQCPREERGNRDWNLNLEGLSRKEKKKLKKKIRQKIKKEFAKEEGERSNINESRVDEEEDDEERKSEDNEAIEINKGN